MCVCVCVGGGGVWPIKTPNATRGERLFSAMIVCAGHHLKHINHHFAAGNRLALHDALLGYVSRAHEIFSDFGFFFP